MRLLVNMFLLFSLILGMKILGVHAHLSKCWRSTWPVKIWERLV